MWRREASDEKWRCIDEKGEKYESDAMHARTVIHENWRERPVLSESLQLTKCVCSVYIAAERSADRCTIEHTHLLTSSLQFAMDALCTIFVNTNVSIQ